MFLCEIKSAHITHTLVGSDDFEGNYLKAFDVLYPSLGGIVRCLPFY